MSSPFQDAFQGLLVNPQTSWDRFFNPQFMINFNSTDAAVENHVLHRVGSYGSQISTILDVLAVLVAQLPKGDLTPEDRRAVDKFEDLVDGAHRAVAEVRGDRRHAVTTGEVDRLVAELHSLARSDPSAHQKLVERLRPAIDGPAG